MSKLLVTLLVNYFLVNKVLFKKKKLLVILLLGTNTFFFLINCFTCFSQYLRTALFIKENINLTIREIKY